MIKDKTEYVQKVNRKGRSIDEANVFSKILFCWICPTFFKGTRRELLVEDVLTDLPASEQSEKLGDRIEKAWFAEELAAKESGRKPSLNRALLKTFFLGLLPSGLLLFISVAILKSLTPKLLAILLKYWDSTNKDAMTKDQAIMYAIVLVVTAFASDMLAQHSLRMNQRFGMTMRVACSTLIYRKVLRMEMADLGGPATGKVVNIMSNDVSRFDYLFIFAHYLWIAPLQVIAVCYLMHQDMGWLSLVGVIILILQTLPVQLYMSKLIARLRFVIAQKTDERVRLMSEIITGIEVIKMYAWEAPFEKVVAASRLAEIKEITKVSYISAVNTGFMLSADRASLFVMVLIWYIRGDPISASVVFSLVQYFNMLKLTLALQLPYAITFTAETRITVRRIEELLNAREREDLASSVRIKYAIIPGELDKSIIKNHQDKTRNGNINCNITSLGYDNKAFDNEGFDNVNKFSSVNLRVVSEYPVDVKNVTARWEDIRPMPTLDNISFQIPHGNLCAVIGSVGSGKSSLLHLLLGELIPTAGDMSVDGQISYASQEPWLFVDTVRRNILFGTPYLEDKYNMVVKVCALEDDFRQFPHGDQSLVGERGVSLSGGQRARINLARAVYREADLYLLDDPLSAVDAIVGRQLFDNCIDGYLKGKTRLLVTHQLHYLKAADIIIVLNNGCVEFVGSYDELIFSGADFAKILASLQEDKELALSMTKSIDKEGTVESVGNYNEQVPPSADIGNSLVSYQDDKESVLNRTTSADREHEPHITAKDENQIENGEILKEEERAMGNQGYALYLNYFLAGSSWKSLTFMTLLLISTQTLMTGTDYWMTYWTNKENTFLKVVNNSTLIDSKNTLEPSKKHEVYDKFHGFDRSLPFFVYLFLVILSISLIFARTAIFFKICMKSSIGLHNQMFHSILRSVMRFFNVNPSGRILNRFSKDIGAVDEVLPRTLVEAVQIYIHIFGILVVVAISLPWTLTSGAILLIYFHITLNIYLKSATAVKRLEGNAKSPVFSHLNSTIRGISTIRCTKTQNMFISGFDDLQDDHSSIWNQYISSACTLGFWLDVSASVYLTFVTFAFLLVEDLGIMAGSVGLAISQTLFLNGMLPHGIKQTAEVISQMTSVERVFQYTKIKAEDGLEGSVQHKPDDWPSSGSIILEKTSLRYASDKPMVLNDLNVNIQAGWKVGIVGRTGAGKTSLIAAIFRLAKVEGTISIDGIDTDSIPLKEMRASISIIPQEPVLFSASIRYNLDPFAKYEDAKLWEALEAVELKESIPTLDFKVLQGGSNFSLGQRQLICLARAILKNNRILVLDEATANVDPQTDSFIQQTIRSKFSNCTVLTIAHRLNTIMDSDRVLVMSFGKAIEFDHPFKLLGNKDGAFYGMVKETGPKMSAQLHSIAKGAFENREDALSDYEVHQSIDIR